MSGPSLLSARFFAFVQAAHPVGRVLLDCRQNRQMRPHASKVSHCRLDTERSACTRQVDARSSRLLRIDRARSLCSHRVRPVEIGFEHRLMGEWARRRREAVEMSTHPSWCVLLIALVLGLSASGSVIPSAQADENSELYPGRYAMVCKPAPIVGCVCDTDTLGQVSIFPRSASEGRASADRVQEVERLRMIDWVRRTCMAMTQPTNPR
jgi:hypothetical protein